LKIGELECGTNFVGGLIVVQ